MLRGIEPRSLVRYPKTGKNTREIDRVPVGKDRATKIRGQNVETPHLSADSKYIHTYVIGRSRAHSKGLLPSTEIRATQERLYSTGVQAIHIATGKL